MKEFKVPNRIMVSFQTVEMVQLEDRARRLDRSISWVIRQICLGKEQTLDGCVQNNIEAKKE